MSIPNYSVTQNEIAAERQHNDEMLKPRRVEQSLEQALETLKKSLDDFSASATSKLAQPRPSVLDHTEK